MLTLLQRFTKIAAVLVCVATYSMGAQAQMHTAESRSRGYLILSGYLNPNTSVVTLPVAFLQDQPNQEVADSGPCVAELLDNTATLLASAHFTAGLTLLTQEPLVQTQSGTPAAGAPTASPQPGTDVKEFEVSVPWHPATQRLQIRCADQLIYTLRRSTVPPAIRLDVPMVTRQVIRGVTTLTWHTTSGNAPILGTQVQFSSNRGQSWTPLNPFAAGSPTHTLRLDTTLLPSGSGHWLRVLVSDGLNSVYATRTISIANPLKIAATAPMANAVDVSPFAPIEVQFVSPLLIAPAAMLSNRFTVLDQQQQSVTGTVSYISETQILRFKPNQPLQGQQRYRVRLAAALRDTTGNTLAGPYEWSFTTGKAGG